MPLCASALADVLHIKASAMKSAVGSHRAQYFANGLDAPFACRLGALDHKSRGAHADDHAVPAAVKGGSSLFNHFVRSCGSAGQKAGTHPTDQIVRRDVVG